MTEKRYYCNENFVVIDSKTKKSCSYFKCMNLLNEREKEIKELKEENEQLKKESKSNKLNKKILKESLDW